MPDIIAKFIARILEFLLWSFVGSGVAIYFFWEVGWWSDELWLPFLLVILGFALLGPPLWRRHGLPKWYKGP